MSTVLVTGVNGFIGSHLAGYLAHRGHRVVGTTSSESSRRIPTPGVVEKIVVPLGERCPRPVMRNVDAVIHNAWDMRPGAAPANVAGTREILDAAEEGGVGWQMFLSSYSAHALTVTAYGRSKLAVQTECVRRGVTVVRPGLVVGAGGVFKRLCGIVSRRSVVPLVDGGRVPIPVVGIADLECAIADILEQRLTGVFNLFNPELVELRTIIEEVCAVTRRQPLLMPMPAALLLGPLWLLNTLGVATPVSADHIRGWRANIEVRQESDLLAFVASPLSLRDMVRSAFDDGVVA
jgi:nucleoside-diphosphate-sugar epimerase